VELPVPASLEDLRIARVASDKQRIVKQVLEPVPASAVLSAAELGTGIYRVLYRDRAAATSFEVDIPLRPEDPRWTLGPRPRPASLDDLVDCRGGSIDAPSPAPGVIPDARLDVAPFRISRRPVRWRDVLEVWPDRGRALLEHSPLKYILGRPLGPEDYDEPASLPWEVAQEFARDVGARLPTVLETHLAWHTPGVELPPAGHRMKAEWNGDVETVFSQMHVTSPYASRDAADWLRATVGQPDFAFTANTAFRLALTADPWLDK
jgi:hypothetical protein